MADSALKCKHRCVRTVLLPMFGAEVSQRVFTPGLSFSVVFDRVLFTCYVAASFKRTFYADNLWSCVCVCEGECVCLRVCEREREIILQ